MINFRIVVKTVGLLMAIVGLFMLLPALVSYIYQGNDISSFLWSSVISIGLGAILYSIKSKTQSIKKRDGYLIVAMGWVSVCLLGSLPYLINYPSTSIIDGIFESCSGFTTTGASIFNDIESLSPGILFWRSLSQWIGGMGIIVFTVAIFPLLGIGGVELFVAEAPGPDANKIHPRITQVAKSLWYIYFGLTVILCLILHFLSGMTFFDAINHALTTMSTGGFSTKNTSIAHFDSPLVQYPIMVFMVIGGINYTVLYFLSRGRIQRALKSDEFKFYLAFVAIVFLFLTLYLSYNQGMPLEESFRKSSFQLASVITTTGFITADYTYWGPGVTLLFFVLIFMGACAGSTSGGIKMIRHYVFLKNALLELKRLLHPSAYIRLKVDQNVVAGRIITHILVFLLIYLIVFIFSSVLMAFLLWEDPQPFLSAIGTVATSMSNVGPAIGSVGPVNNFAHLPGSAKLLCSSLMIIGRLELFTILIIFTPYFWRTN